MWRLPARASPMIQVGAVLLLLLTLVSSAPAEEVAPTPTGVIVYDAAKRVLFEVMRDAVWDPQTWAYSQRAYGSGVGYRSDGWIVTTAHQIAEASSVSVVCPDGIGRRADVWHVSEALDLGVVHIPEYRVSVPDFGGSDALRVGERVYAAGKPWGFQQSLSAGIVSGLHRVIITDGELERQLQDHVQFDAEVARGHSGGPLLNRNAEIVGIITFSLGATKNGPSGLNFALPTDVVRAAADRMIDEGRSLEFGKLTWSGRGLHGVPREVRTRHGLVAEQGVVLVEVGADAQHFGLRPHDVVLAVNGLSISTAMQLKVRLALPGPGQRAVLSIDRQGKKLEIPVVTGKPASK